MASATSCQVKFAFAWCLTFVLMLIWPIAMFAAHGQYAAQWIFDQTTYTVFHIAIFPTIVALTISTYQLPAQRAVYFPIATLIAVLCFILVILDDPDSPQSRYLFTNSKHLYKLEQDTRDAWKKYAESLQDAENRNELQNQWRKARGTLEKETQRQTRNGMFCLNSLFTFIVASFLLSVFYMQSIANSFEASSKKKFFNANTYQRCCNSCFNIIMDTSTNPCRLARKQIFSRPLLWSEGLAK